MTQKYGVSSVWQRPTFVTMHKLSKLQDTASSMHSSEENQRQRMYVPSIAGQRITNESNWCEDGTLRQNNAVFYNQRMAQTYYLRNPEEMNSFYSTAVSCAPRFVCTYSTLSKNIPSYEEMPPSSRLRTEGDHKKNKPETAYASLLTRNAFTRKPSLNSHSTVCVDTVGNMFNPRINIEHKPISLHKLQKFDLTDFRSPSYNAKYTAGIRSPSNSYGLRRNAFSLEGGLKQNVNGFDHVGESQKYPRTSESKNDHENVNKRNHRCRIRYIDSVYDSFDTDHSRRQSRISDYESVDSITGNSYICTEYVDHRKNQLNRIEQEKYKKKLNSKQRNEFELKKLYESGVLSSVLEKASHFEDVDPDRFERRRNKLPAPELESYSNRVPVPEKHLFWNARIRSSHRIKDNETSKLYNMTVRNDDDSRASSQRQTKSKHSHLNNVRAIFENKSAATKCVALPAKYKGQTHYQDKCKKSQSDDEDFRRWQHVLDDEETLTLKSKQSTEYRNTTPQKAIKVQLGTLTYHKEGKHEKNEIKKGIRESSQVIPVKEGVLYCKMVKEDGKKAVDRSWRGAWAVLHSGSLYLCKEKKDGILIPLNADSFPINLKAIRVSPADDYTKKPRVFRIITSTGTEILFQAADIQSLCEWVHEIRKCSISDTAMEPPVLNEILHRNDSSTSKRSSTHSKFRKSIHRKDSKMNMNDSKCDAASKRIPDTAPRSSASQDDVYLSNRHKENFVRSFVRRGLRGILSTGINDASEILDPVKTDESEHVNFGVRLELCESSSISEHVPIVVEILSKLIELRGITYVGLYRQTGSIQTTNWLISQLDRGVKDANFSDERWYDVKAIASALKTFFARLPECLFGDKFYAVLMDASRIEEHKVRLKEIRTLLHQLSPHRFETLKFLTRHFRAVAAHCLKNKIDARNIAIIFGPTLLWYKKRSVAENLTDNPEKIRLLESLIYYHSWFFNATEEADDVPEEINPELPDIICTDSEVSDHLEPPSAIALRIVNAAVDRWGDVKRNVNRVNVETGSPARMSVSVKRCSSSYQWHTFLSKNSQAISLIEFCGKVDDSPKICPFKKSISFKCTSKDASNNQSNNPLRRNALSFKLCKNPSVKLERRHTFSTILEILANGAKAGSKWWTQVNIFPVPN